VSPDQLLYIVIIISLLFSFLYTVISAKKLGFGGGTISKWEKSSPTVERLQKVADYFKISTDYLLRKEIPSAEQKYIDVPIDQETFGLMFKIPKLTEKEKVIVSDLIDSLLRNRE
jgi:transcriptional regulator with XRE-family HTH domain